MEFVIATFPQVRGLRVDGAPQGQTGQLIGVQRGHHIFDLGNPKDYAPLSVPATVMGTSQAQPMVIPFQPAMQAADVVPAAPTRAAAAVAPPMPEPAEITGAKAMVPTSTKKLASRLPKNQEKKTKQPRSKHASSAKARTKKGSVGKDAKPTKRAKAARSEKALMAPTTRGPKGHRAK